MKLIDTHCHIHDPDFFEGDSGEGAYHEAVAAGVTGLLLVGTSLASSRRAVDFAAKFPEACRASVGIHPHEAKDLTGAQIEDQLKELEELARSDEVAAIGECGFDFYYNDRSELLAKQRRLLEGQLRLAAKLDLPVCFHVREGFEDFWPVFDGFPGLRGVLHSFTDRQANLDKALERGLFIGVNGIATFTSHQWQRDLYASIPLSNLLLETDSPFLTPTPLRGTINKPKNVIYITRYLAELRKEAPESIGVQTTINAKELFGFDAGQQARTSNRTRGTSS